MGALRLDPLLYEQPYCEVCVIAIVSILHGICLVTIWCFDKVAKAMRYLSSGLAYVQDERYAAGAGSAGAVCFSYAQLIPDTYVIPVRLRAAHPCALSRSTVHPEHNILA